MGEFTLKRNHHTCLSEMHAGENGIIEAFKGGHFLFNRLVSLGLTPGVRVDIAQNYGHGPLIIKVRGTLIALGRGEAAHILITIN
jgi:ferrous iron transport protein A